MRLHSLHLERYGPFTDRIVAFRPGARLHVVIGPNEAGKTSALAAVTDLLFGIEHRTRHAYLHDMNVLRLGAEIESADGQRLAFRRRKGLRNTLVDAADAALPDDVLAPFLKGLTREVFCRAFGLDADSLRAGGREMMDVNGEVGASLFAAGSGLRGYTTLQGSLEEESQKIFAPRRAKDRSFYQALDRYDEARKAIRATELREGAWRELNGEIGAAAARLDEIRARRERIAAERARLERLKRVGPLIAAIDAAQAQAQADAGLVEAGDAAIDRLGGCLDAARNAAAEQARLDTTLAVAQAELDAVPPPSPLLGSADAILERLSGIDRYDKDGVDLPRVQAEAVRLNDDLDRLAIRVGLRDGAELAQRQPSDAALRRLDALIQEGRTVTGAVERLTRELAAARAEREELLREQAEGGAPVDPAPFREALAPLARLRADLAKRADLDATIRHAANVLRGQAAQMSPPVSDVAALALSPLPGSEAVARFRIALDDLDRRRAMARQRCETSAASVRAARERLREREAGRPIASRTDLLVSRTERDAAFAALRVALSEGARLPAAAVAAYERALYEADRLADDLAADAIRVAGQAADRERLEADEAEASAGAEALAGIERERTAMLGAWIEAWRPSGVVPDSPAEMLQWLGAAEALIEAQGDLDARRLDAAMLAERIEMARSPLEHLAVRVGLDDVAGHEHGLVLDRVEQRVSALARRWEETRETNARIRAAATAIARHESELNQARERIAAWRMAWGEALPAIGLTEMARIEEAEGALAAWREVPFALRERDTADRRVSGMRRDRDAYRVEVERLAHAVPGLDPGSPSATIRALHKRLQAAQADETRRAELAKRRDAAQNRTTVARRGLDAARATLSELLATLDPSIDADAQADVETLHARLLARRAKRSELGARRAELVRAADGVDEAALRTDLAATSADAIEAELAALSAEREENDSRGQVVFADRQDAERRKADLESGTGAELALAQRKAAEAELAQCARQWAVLRLAHLMLGTAIGRHRAGQQDPLLARAGALFAALTGGAFNGLAQDYGEGDEPRIVGRRPKGETVSVEGLSEGTRDQLYLALRLAYLQDFATRSEPAPFVGDDLFLTFDDARTAHGLEALASIGDRIQPILFTHHRHVAELALARLGEGVDLVEL